MIKKTIAYLSLTLCILVAVLYLNGFRLTSSSIYKEHAKANMSKTHTVLFENDEFGIVEFEGITEIIPVEKTLFLYRDAIETEKSIDYPLSNVRFKDYITYNQIIHSQKDPYTFRIDFLNNGTDTQSQKDLGYVYVYNSTPDDIQFKSWNILTDEFEVVDFESVHLDENSELLYSKALLKPATKLIPFMKGELIRDKSVADDSVSGLYNGKEITKEHVTELLSLPFFYDSDKQEADFSTLTPLVALEVTYESTTNTNPVQNFYYYYRLDNAIYIEMYDVYYKVSKTLFEEVVQKIELTQE